MRRLMTVAVTALALSACQTVKNEAGTPTTYQDPASMGAVRGVGIESQDIISMTDAMMRDMLAEPRLANASPPPNVIIDSEHFVNESSTRINRNIITRRLLSGLQKASQGRMQFLARHNTAMVESERNLKRKGVVDKGANPTAAAVKGGDYRLGGTITSQDKRDAKTGMVERYTMIYFDMTDLETGEIVWTGTYEMSKSGSDDVIYR